MKRLLGIFLLVAGVNSYANKLLYCPERIECSGNTIESCRAIGGNQEVFKVMHGRNIAKAIYAFASADGVYEPGDLEGAWFYNRCNYEYKPFSRITKVMVLSIDKNTSLAIHFEDIEKNKWIVAYSITAQCKSTTTQDCPFKQEVKS